MKSKRRRNFNNLCYPRKPVGLGLQVKGVHPAQGNPSTHPFCFQKPGASPLPRMGLRLLKECKEIACSFFPREGVLLPPESPTVQTAQHQCTTQDRRSPCWPLLPALSPQGLRTKEILSLTCSGHPEVTSGQVHPGTPAGPLWTPELSLPLHIVPSQHPMSTSDKGLCVPQGLAWNTGTFALRVGRLGEDRHGSWAVS